MGLLARLASSLGSLAAPRQWSVSSSPPVAILQLPDRSPSATPTVSSRSRSFLYLCSGSLPQIHLPLPCFDPLCVQCASRAHATIASWISFYSSYYLSSRSRHS